MVGQQELGAHPTLGNPPPHALLSGQHQPVCRRPEGEEGSLSTQWLYPREQSCGPSGGARIEGASARLGQAGRIARITAATMTTELDLMNWELDLVDGECPRFITVANAVNIDERAASKLELAADKSRKNPVERMGDKRKAQPTKKDRQRDVELGLVGRTEASKLLGISTLVLRRRYEGKDLAVVADTNGRVRFRLSQVEALALTLKAASGGVEDGAVGATVMRLLSEGVSSLDVILRTRLPSQVVRFFLAEYEFHRGGVFLDGETLRKIEAVSWRGGPKELKTALDVLEAFTDSKGPGAPATPPRPAAPARPLQRPEAHPQPQPSRAKAKATPPPAVSPGVDLQPESSDAVKAAAESILAKFGAPHEPEPTSS